MARGHKGVVEGIYVETDDCDSAATLSEESAVYAVYVEDTNMHGCYDGEADDVVES
jgi:hypothetical protein